METIYLHGDIGTEDCTSAAVSAQLAKIGSDKPVLISVNSFGGSFFDGTAIGSLLKRHRGKVIARIDGVAASAASLLIMGADEIRMARGAWLMLHSPLAVTKGNATELSATVAILRTLEVEMAETYARRAKVPVETAMAWMTRETWLDGPQAVAAGLADALDDDDALPIAASVAAKFRNLPRELRAKLGGLDPRAARRARREAILVAARPVRTPGARLRSRIRIAARLRADQLLAEARAAPPPVRRYGVGGDPNRPPAVTFR